MIFSGVRRWVAFRRAVAWEWTSLRWWNLVRLGDELFFEVSMVRRRRRAAWRPPGDDPNALIQNTRLWRWWMIAFERAYAAPTKPPTKRCPCCGQRGLRLMFTGGEDLIGFASMWCPRCLLGIGTCRTLIPDDAPRLPWEHPDRRLVPNYRLIWPRT